jgi:4-oxalocrotonate tautomerase family enzyme
MPYLHCNVQQGLSAAQKRQLALELTAAVKEIIGSPTQYIHIGITEIPGNEFIESGQLNLAYESRVQSSASVAPTKAA